MPLVSVVVCTYRRQRLLPELFATLAAQSRPADEILIVDNEVSPATEALVRATAPELRLRCLAEPCLGLSHARNRGIAAARGEWIVFLDDDALPEPGWLAALTAAAESHPDVGILAGPIRLLLEAAPPPWFPGDVLPYVHWLGHLDFGAEDLLLTPEGGSYRGPGGGNMAVRRTVLDAVGPFAGTLGRSGSSLISGEEVLLVERARRLGQRVRYVAAAAVHHLVPAERLDRAWFLPRAFAEGRSQARIMAEIAGPGSPALADELDKRAAAVEDLGHKLAATGLGFGQLRLKAQIDFALVLGVLSELAALLARPRASLGLRSVLPSDPALPDEWRQFCAA